MRIILVTGGAGFVGSHLCDHLLKKKNIHVICLDNFSTGRKENITHLMGDPRFTLIEHDIVEPLYIEARKIDQIYNLACPASPVNYQANAVRTIKINTIGVINVLGLAKKHNARILQASTSEVYGDPLEHPQRESYNGNVNPIGSRACYDEGKRIAEALFFEYRRMHGLDICVARIFNAYGPRMFADDGRVVSNFIAQALAGKPLTIYGDGKQTRSFCYVSDMVEGLVKLMNSRETGPINLGNPDERTILELAKKIIAMTDSSSRSEFKKRPDDDPYKRKPDIGIAQKKLKWKPHVSLENGLATTIEYFRNESALNLR